MKSINLSFAIGLSVSLLIVGVAVGYYLTPEYRSGMMEMKNMDLGVADRWVDLRYLDSMASHHQGAINLALQAKANTDRKEITELADMIVASEPTLIKELMDWKKAWYGNSRKYPEPKELNLGGKDVNSDLRFLNALIAHHQAGIEMTQEIRGKSSRSEILDNAFAVEKFLTESSAMLEKWRFEWYKVK